MTLWHNFISIERTQSLPRWNVCTLMRWNWRCDADNEERNSILLLASALRSSLPHIDGKLNCCSSIFIINHECRMPSMLSLSISVDAHAFAMKIPSFVRNNVVFHSVRRWPSASFSDRDICRKRLLLSFLGVPENRIHKIEYHFRSFKVATYCSEKRWRDYWISLLGPNRPEK